jgi:hypothetical protein
MDIKLQQIINAGATFEQEAKDSIASKLKTKNTCCDTCKYNYRRNRNYN